MEMIIMEEEVDEEVEVEEVEVEEVKVVDVVIGLRVTEDEEREGLDVVLHGERLG